MVTTRDLARYLLTEFRTASAEAWEQMDRGNGLEAMVAHQRAQDFAGILSVLTADIQWSGAEADHRARVKEHLSQILAWKAFKALEG